ncbi:MAG: heavy metal translocating P-type ATPase metal-binding domain-containing protein, partial [Oligoflexia bacterium]|nr:heavy metal translocating P-type ATPase metal-binding domain-containing protein [Oligoflexia bacterium]
MAPGLVAATPALSIPCLHCGRASGESFCCEGCEAVFAILHSRGLSEYYALKKTGGWLRQPLPAAVPGRSYTYLDDPAFLKLYAMSAPGGGLEMTFYAEGIHCVACVWLLEKLPELVKGLSSVRLDLGSSTALVRIPEGGSFAAAAREFERLGYRPHPVRGEELEQHQKRENRQMLIRLGIAGACHGNLMLLAVSLYGGATGTLAKAFSWVSLALFLPVAIYSAVPFYRDAWVSLRTRRISIDVPIALGVVGGTLASTVNLFRGSSHIYFDSLSSLVFLLLGSRYLLKRAHENAFRSSKLLHFLMPSSVRRRLAQTESYEQVGIEVIAPGDVVKVLPNEPIPVDGTVIAGRSTIHCALLTGESDPVGVGEGEIVHAGTVNQASVLEIRATGAGYATRLGRILKAIEEGAQRKAPIVTLTDAVARRFVGAVLVFAALAWLGTGWHLGWEAGFERALALLIITCPCGLALATPLALSISIGKAARSGLLIKGADVLERLARVDKVFLDKTGTLTTGEFEVLEWSVAPGDERIAAHAAVALESRSNHPIAKAVVRHLIRSRQVRDADRLPAVEDFEETAGK